MDGPLVLQCKHDNEGLASILTNNLNPIAYIKEKNNYPRITGFISSSVIIQIGIPTPKKLQSVFWYGIGNNGRNAKNVKLYASNYNWYNNLSASNRDKMLGEFTVDKNSSSTNPTKFGFSIQQEFSNFYFHILDNWGDPIGTKIDRILLIF